MQEQQLVSTSDYMQSGIHIGTNSRTKDMSPFIYKIRTNKLSIFNIKKIDERIVVSSNFMSQFNIKDILVVCRRENGFKPVTSFNRYTGIDVCCGDYKPGTLTNTNSQYFKEYKVILIVDVNADRTAKLDAFKMGTPIIALCDSESIIKYIDLVVPCNNKGNKSLGLIFYLLTKEFLKNKNIEKEIKIDDFMN